MSQGNQLQQTTPAPQLTAEPQVAPPQGNVPAAPMPGLGGGPPPPSAPPPPQQPVRPLDQAVEQVQAADAQNQLAGRKVMAQTDKALGTEEAATQKDADLAAHNAELVAPMQADLAKHAEEAQQLQAQLHQEAAARTQKQMGEITKMQDDMSKDTRLQQSYWADKGIGTKIGWCIASALGGFVSATKGGPNQGLESLNETIAQDAQNKARIRQGYLDKIGAKKEEMQLGRQQDADEQLRILQDINLGTAATEARIKSVIANTGNQQAQINGQKLLAELEQKRATINASIAQQLSAHHLQAAENSASLMAKKEEMDTHAALTQWTMAQKAKGSTMGLPMRAPTSDKAAYQQLAKYHTAYSGLDEAIRNIQNKFDPKDASGKSVGGGSSRVDYLVPGSDTAHEVDQAYDTIKASVLKMMTSDGRAPPGAKDVVTDMLGGGKYWAGLHPKQFARNLENLRAHYKDMIEQYATQTGQVPVSKDVDPLDADSVAKFMEAQKGGGQ